MAGQAARALVAMAIGLNRTISPAVATGVLIGLIEDRKQDAVFRRASVIVDHPGLWSSGTAACSAAVQTDYTNGPPRKLEPELVAAPSGADDRKAFASLLLGALLPDARRIITHGSSPSEIAPWPHR